MSRYKFRQRSQQAGESVIQFVAALRELATFCSFGGLCEEMIRDQLIEKTSVNRIRERLLMEPDSLTVDRAIQLALQVETAMLEARTLQPSLVSGSSQVQHVSRKPFRAHGESKYPPSPAAKPPAERNGRFSGKRCTNCGSGSHNTHDKSCPARGVQCRSCGKANHFAKWCRSKPAAVKQVAQDPKKDVKESVTVFSLRSETNETGYKSCQVNVQDVELDLLIDLGAKVSIINESTFKEHFSSQKLDSPSQRLVCYNNEEIEVLGVVRLSVQYQEQR